MAGVWAGENVGAACSPSPAGPELRQAVLAEALTGLRAEPKTLEPWLFYDAEGSRLFERITALPEYYLTRTERALFERLAPELASRVGRATLVELGAGTAAKTGVLLREFARRQRGVLYQPVDVSASALEEAAEALTREIAWLQVQPQVSNYVTEPYEVERPAGMQVLALYIGSSIGNFSPELQVGILRNLRRQLRAGEKLLLGLDMAPDARKTVAQLVAAYDDAAGVTAEFNRNVLVRLNRELGAEFAVERFRHVARWNAAASRMEMHLESAVPQTVTIAGECFSFAAGETIHTENSYKFTQAQVDELLLAAGFALEERWADEAHAYSVVLAQAV
ncbi:MAG: L-histidine N(alpha)-methyltransferase [Acidobacteriaceae bacterium]|nr:L-histidine N(alpha)-methyltransferase [Acidobacteriaceae bacterium]